MEKINHNNIKFYLQKFFEGETNCEEETALSQYFKNVENLPKEVEEYKSLFEWIDNGMPENKDNPINLKKDINSVLKKYRISSLSAAALFGVILTCIMIYMKNYSEVNPEVLYAGSYVYHDGVRNDDIHSILPEIKSIIDQVDEMERKIESLNYDIVVIDISD